MRSFTIGAVVLAMLFPSIAWAEQGGAPAPAAAQAPPPAPVAGWQDGFFLQTPNGDYRLVIGYLGQLDGRFIKDDAFALGTDTFLIRKVRPTFTGRIGRYFDFKMMPDLGNGTTMVADAYFDIRFSPKFRVRTGKDKSPVGYELLIGDGFVLFPERAIASNLVPNRDVGFQLQGDLFGNKLFYSGGLFNGIPDGASTVTEIDLNAGKDAIGRVVITPWRTAPPAAGAPTPRLSGLGFAVGGSAGQQTGLLPTYRSPSLQPFFSYAGAAADGERTRVSPSVFYYYRVFGGFAEYMNSSQWVSKAGIRRKIQNNAWEITGSWVLTGENGTERGVRPRANFDPVAGSWGAVQLLARYSELHVDPEAFEAGFAAPDASRTAQTYAFGLDWYPNPFVKLYASYERTWFEGGANNTDRPTENLFVVRTQIAF